MSKYIKWFIEHRIFSLIGLLAAGITIYSFFGPSTEETISKNLNKSESIVQAEKSININDNSSTTVKDGSTANIDKSIKIDKSKNIIDKSTTIINPTPPPRGRCGSGIANPEGWWGEVPECGEEGDWLYDCDRKAYIRNFLPTIRTFPETEKRIRECK